MIDYKYTPASNFSDAIQNLYDIITILRSPEGCPWDRVQTPKQTAQNILDETYEYLDGVVKNSIPSEREEIGDVLINVMMALRIHEEQNDFEPYESINEVCEKLIRRHPHVFSTSSASNVEEVLQLWNSVKEKVEGHTLDRKDIFEHVPTLLPKLAESYEIQKVLKKNGFAEDSLETSTAMLENSVQVVRESLYKEDTDSLEQDFGALLYSIVNLARQYHISSETALHRYNQEVKNKYQKAVDKANANGIPIDKDHAADILSYLGE